MIINAFTILGRRMRRVSIVLGFLCLLAAIGAGAASAQPFRFPQDGTFAFRGDLPKGWSKKTDKSGGLLLIAPGERALVYLAVTTDEKLRGKPARAIADQVANVAGIEQLADQGAARISDADGGKMRRGSAFSGMMPAKRGLARKARIIVIPLAAATWAQVLTVTQPGLNPVETDALDRALNGLTLGGGKKK